MSPHPITIAISILALIFSGISLFFTFRKDAHRVKLRIVTNPSGARNYISINNDSATSVQVQSIGTIDDKSKINWLTSCCDAIPNESVQFPKTVDARSTFEASVSTPNKKNYAYCVQLACGRTFVVNNTLNKKCFRGLWWRSLLSRITAGRKGFSKNNVHLQKFNINNT